MDLTERLKLLTDGARFEVAGQRARAAGPFRVLMNSACDRNCAFCPSACSVDGPRAALKPDELAATVSAVNATGDAPSLLLSSGVCGSPDAAMEPMLTAVRLLRERHAYDGYIHLKVMPGASDAAIRAAVTAADRVSVNLDVPNAARLARIEPGRNWETEVAGTLWRARSIAEAIRAQTGVAADVATALVVGAAGEKDTEILETMGRCYGPWGVRRVHFGRFEPVPGTPLEAAPETLPIRVRRLTETDWLLRRFGFGITEFLTRDDGNLDPFTDPKVAIALRRPDDFPVEVTTAGREDLLRVPGIGELSARRILRARQTGHVRDIIDLRAMGVVTIRAAAFITIRGRRPSSILPTTGIPQAHVKQLTLW